MSNPRLDGLYAMLLLAPLEYENVSEEEFKRLQNEVEKKKRLENIENQIIRNKQKMEKQTKRRRF